MNLLFVTENMQGANLTKHELAQEMPGLHVEISPDVLDANRQLAVPGRYHAVLLDSGLHEGDPLTIIKTLRTRKMAIAAIGLIEPADLESGINMMGAGADDYVVKRPGFITTLAGVVQRACGHYAAFHNLEPSAVPVRRNPTGATCVLLRNIVGIDAAPKGASRIEQYGEGDSGEVADAGLPGRNAEIRVREMEFSGEALHRSTGSSGEDQMYFTEEHGSARSQWEKERRHLDQRLRSEEEQLLTQADPLPEAAGNSQMVNEFRARARAVKDQLGELETKCRNLEENLQSAQASLAEQAKVLQYERDQRSLETDDLRNQLNLLEEQRKTMETQLADRTEELLSGREQWDLRQTAWEERMGAVEESFAKIEQTALRREAEQEEMAARFAADLSKSENARRELEQELRRADEERARLQESVRAAEARISEQAGQIRTERERWEPVRLMLEQQRDALEARVAQLEAAGDKLAKEHDESLAQAEKSRLEIEGKAAALADELQTLLNEHNDVIEKQESERIRWKSDRHELEQRSSALEEELRLTKQSLEKLVKEEEAYRSRWESSFNELEQLRVDAGSAHALAREAADRYLVQLDKLRELPRASSAS